MTIKAIFCLVNLNAFGAAYPEVNDCPYQWQIDTYNPHALNLHLRLLLLHFNIDFHDRVDIQRWQKNHVMLWLFTSYWTQKIVLFQMPISERKSDDLYFQFHNWQTCIFIPLSRLFSPLTTHVYSYTYGSCLYFSIASLHKHSNNPGRVLQIIFHKLIVAVVHLEETNGRECLVSTLGCMFRTVFFINEWRFKIIELCFKEIYIFP
jgi:hypothetical protein